MLRVCGGIPLLCKDSLITDMPEGLVCLPVDELLSCCMAVEAADCFWGEEEVLSPIIDLITLGNHGLVGQFGINKIPLAMSS